MMLLLQLVPFFVVAAIAALAVLSHCFDDNLLQRIGLSAISIGSTLMAFVLWRGGDFTRGSCVLMGYGLAIYGVGTVFKFFGRRHLNDSNTG